MTPYRLNIRDNRGALHTTTITAEAVLHPSACAAFGIAGRSLITLSTLAADGKPRTMTWRTGIRQVAEVANEAGLYIGSVYMDDGRVAEVV